MSRNLQICPKDFLVPLTEKLSHYQKKHQQLQFIQVATAVELKVIPCHIEQMPPPHHTCPSHFAVPQCRSDETDNLFQFQNRKVGKIKPCSWGPNPGGGHSPAVASSLQFWKTFHISHFTFHISNFTFQISYFTIPQLRHGGWLGRRPLDTSTRTA